MISKLINNPHVSFGSNGLLSQLVVRNMISPIQKSYLYLHISVILWGFTAILGALISLSATSLVWWRVLITSAFMLFIPGVLKEIRRLPPKLMWKFFGIGILVGAHWICFYGSIKLANASIALVCMSTASLFTAFFEPWITRKHLNKVDIIFGILIIPAMILTTQGLEWQMMQGFWVGILSAALAALFAVFNKQYISQSSPQAVTAIEMSSAWLFLSLLFPILIFSNYDLAFIPSSSDIIYLLVLAILCTVVPFILHLKAYEHLSAFTSNLIINLEPVYGIFLAILILNEHHDLSYQFYSGVILILLIVLLYPIIKRRSKTTKS